MFIYRAQLSDASAYSIIRLTQYYTPLYYTALQLYIYKHFKLSDTSAYSIIRLIQYYIALPLLAMLTPTASPLAIP